MRKRHELEKGIVCERCKQKANKPDYISIASREPLLNDTTGKLKTIDRMNLCKSCYKIYVDMIYENLLKKGVCSKND